MELWTDNHFTSNSGFLHPLLMMQYDQKQIVGLVWLTTALFDTHQLHVVWSGIGVELMLSYGPCDLK